MFGKELAAKVGIRWKSWGAKSSAAVSKLPNGYLPVLARKSFHAQRLLYAKARSSVNGWGSQK